MVLQQFLFWLISVNVFLAVLETVPELQVNPIFQHRFELFTIIIFSIEYIGRIWTLALHKELKTKTEMFLHIFSPLLLLDLAVIISFGLHYFALASGQVIVIFRFLRIFRSLRLIKQSHALNRITAVLKKEKEELATVIFLMLVMLVISSTLLYLAEHNVPNTQFTSIPATFWWGVATLTTIGYGDMVPVTALGKIFGALTAIVGVGLFALPTGLLGASFYQNVSKDREQDIRKIGRQVSKIQSYTEESGEMLEQYTEKQKRKIARLERELTQAKTELDEKSTKKR